MAGVYDDSIEGGFGVGLGEVLSTRLLSILYLRDGLGAFEEYLGLRSKKLIKPKAVRLNEIRQVNENNVM